MTRIVSRLVLIFALVVAVAFFVLPVDTASAHTTQGSATPSNDGTHPWPVSPSERSACSTPANEHIGGISAVPGVFDFNHACKHHDGCYEGFPRNGEPTYWVSRWQCDEWFYRDMRASCEEQARWDVLGGCYNQADIYWSGVRVGGVGAYKGPYND